MQIEQVGPHSVASVVEQAIAEDMSLIYRVDPSALRLVGLTTTAIAAEPATTSVDPRLLNLSEVATPDHHPREALDERE